VLSLYKNSSIKCDQKRKTAHFDRFLSAGWNRL